MDILDSNHNQRNVMNTEKGNPDLATCYEPQESVQVSILNNIKSITRGEPISFPIELHNINNDKVIAPKDVTVTLICVGTAVNGDEYIGSSKVVIPAGCINTDFNVLEEDYLKEEEVSNIKLTLAKVTDCGLEDLTINPTNNVAEVKIIHRPQAFLNIKEVTVDQQKGRAEFTVNLMGATLNKNASVDYIASDIASGAIGSQTFDSGTLTFDPGVTAHSVTLPIYFDDSLHGSGMINVVLSNAVNATIIESPCLSDIDSESVDSVSTYVSLTADSDNLGNFNIELRDLQNNPRPATANLTAEIHYKGNIEDGGDFVGVAKLIIPAQCSKVNFAMASLDNDFCIEADNLILYLNKVTDERFAPLALDANKAVLEICLNQSGDNKWAS